MGRHLAEGACIARRDPQQLFETEAGKAEYKKTAICEKCWDTLTDNVTDDTTAHAQCDALTAAGIQLAKQWIELEMCKDSLTMSKHGCEAAILLALGTVELPKVYVS